MKIFTSNKELQAQIAALESELEAAQTKAARADELEREMAELKAGFDTERNDFSAQNAALENELTAAKGRVSELESKVTELEQSAEITKEKVSLEAARQLAAAGHPPIEGIAEETVDPYAGKSKAELQAIAQSMNHDPKAQKAFVSKYLRPLVGTK